MAAVLLLFSSFGRPGTTLIWWSGAVLTAAFGIYSGVMAIKRDTLEMVGVIGIAGCSFTLACTALAVPAFMAQGAH